MIEIMLVAILLAIFAGLALINIQTLFVENQKKCSYSDLRMLSEGLFFVYNDVGIYPKLSYLTQTRPLMNDPVLGTTQDIPLLRNIQYMGFDVSHMRKRLEDRWTGKYMGASPSRFIDIDIAPAQAPLRVKHPKDFWGTPYVVYFLKLDDQAPNGVDFVRRLGDQPDFDIALVSYGPDRVPGSFINRYGHSPAEGFRKDNQRLFIEVGFKEYRMPEAVEYDAVRLEGYSEQQFGQGGQWIGVIDPGSDDIVIRLQ